MFFVTANSVFLGRLLVQKTRFRASVRPWSAHSCLIFEMLHARTCCLNDKGGALQDECRRLTSERSGLAGTACSTHGDGGDGTEIEVHWGRLLGCQGIRLSPLVHECTSTNCDVLQYDTSSNRRVLFGLGPGSESISPRASEHIRSSM